jgi:hypothetical protein
MLKQPEKDDDTFALNLTSARGDDIDGDRAIQDEITAAVGRIIENRSAIEQAKGMIMLIYGIDAEAAFEMLAQRSQNNNVKLRSLAHQIVTDFVALNSGETLPPLSAYHDVVSTAHLRVDAWP